MTDALVPYGDLERMAETVCKAGLFPGIKTPQQALTLFLVAQAEGLHPMTATMRYNIIQNRPAMKAEAMLASFMERGGTVDWTEYTDEAVTGVFTSKGVPNGVKVRWTMADAKRAGVTMNQTWTKYPRQMLKARVASDGVRMADPSVNSGRYTPEEVADFDKPQTVAADAEVVAGNPRTEPATTDLTSALEASIAIAEAKKNAALDARCPECASITEVYASTQKGANAGRKYRQCKFAHDAIMDDMAQGIEAKLAYAAQAKHLRTWIEPPKAKDLYAGVTKAVFDKFAQGAAPEADRDVEPPSKPEEPAPSIFEQLDNISKEQERKWGKK